MRRADLDEELRDLAGMTYALAVDKIGPIVAETEEASTFSPTIRSILAGAGFLGLVVPEEYGGAGGDIRHQAIVLEELARVYPSACTYLTAHWLATKLIALNATGDEEPDWVRPLLADVVEGTRLGAIAVTEPDHGSDLASITSKAHRDGDSWVIDGSKRFITNGGFAEFYTVLARTGGPGFSRPVPVLRRGRSPRRRCHALGAQDGPARLSDGRDEVRRRSTCPRIT